MKIVAKELKEDSKQLEATDEKAVDNFNTQLFHHIRLSSIIESLNSEEIT